MPLEPFPGDGTRPKIAVVIDAWPGSVYWLKDAAADDKRCSDAA